MNTTLSKLLVGSHFLAVSTLMQLVAVDGVGRDLRLFLGGVTVPGKVVSADAITKNEDGKPVSRRVTFDYVLAGRTERAVSYSDSLALLPSTPVAVEALPGRPSVARISFSHCGRGSLASSAFLILFQLIGAALIASVWLNRRARNLRALCRLRRHSPASAVGGVRLRVVGQVRCHTELLVEPITQTRCVGYHLTVVEQSGEDTSTVLSQTRCAPFDIVDAHDTITVETAGLGNEADRLLASRETSSPGGLCDQEFLARHGLTDRDRRGCLVYSIAILTNNTEVAVGGTVVRRPVTNAVQVGRGGYRSAAEYLAIVGTIEPLLLSNLTAATKKP